MKLIVHALSCWRGERPVLSNLDLAVEGGEALIVLGPNGAGKTTLLRVLAGLIRPSRGSVRLDGGEADAPPSEQCHFVGHRDAVKSALTVAENLRFWADFYGGSAGAVPAALSALNLGALAELPAGYLSAGQRRRLSLARLHAVRRPIWLLDEPTAALDRDGQALLGDLVRAHLAARGIVIAATHLPLPFDATRSLDLEAGA